ncbi:ANTAR domain-containing protein [Rhodoferax sp. GW822-FHT02A01]|uniref:ANTAR domain-containing protein n=1 Tax=Rhodoferax sp. GW822-FHT02A01 TaxID=3141537 RepID=UPI00315DE60A
MTSALLCVTRQLTAPSLKADLQDAGITVLASLHEVNKLVQAVAIHAPDVVICDEPSPSSSWFDAIQLFEKAMPCPLIVFTHDSDAKNIERSIASGIHVYAVNGYSSNRLRPLIQLAQARFRHEQQLRKAYEDMATRYEERKVVDRAKGILMRAQQISDDDAFKVLRSTAMSSNQRMGQLSQHVIQSARFAEAVNHSGQLRMLSQRLFKLHLLKESSPQSEQYADLLQKSVDWVNGNFELLRKSISLPTFGDLLDQVEKSWGQLKTALTSGPSEAVEDLAENLLQGAERLTARLEASGQATPLRLLNLAGRQRMLSQRYARFALQTAEPQGASSAAVKDGMLAAQTEFEAALTSLNAIPLSDAAIHQTLQDAGIAWLRMVAATKSLPGAAPRKRVEFMDEVFQSSEKLLELFDQLAAHYERSLEVLVG